MKLLKPIVCVAFAAAALLSTSCYRQATSSEVKGRGEYQVDYLFEQDGVKVYRFYDSSGPVYFTTRGDTAWQTGGKGSHPTGVPAN